MSKKFYIETYGCQMNVSDTELVISILKSSGFIFTKNIDETDIIFVNTCSVRANAETRVFGRLEFFKHKKKTKKHLLIGVLGCMAERLKNKLLEEDKLIDLVVGPDAYRDLPKLISNLGNGQQAINVLLSREETYADISPIRLSENKITAFVSIMRGCNNMCSFCIVPFVRGRERSRDFNSILKEIKDLIKNGYKEVTLLGQNVDKYNWKNEVNFSQLLEMVAKINSKFRIRFSTSYPQDMTDEVLKVMKKYDNICKYIHLPVQSGSSEVLKNMRRGYTREIYLDRIKAIKKIIPDCAISTDLIAGFCGETEENHKETLNLITKLEFDFSYMFKYSERPNTYAHKYLKDDITKEIKSRRLTEIIDLQNAISKKNNQKYENKIFEVLVEGFSKKSKDYFFGRNSQNKVIVFKKESSKIGDFVNVFIEHSSIATLIGKIVN